MMREAVRFVVLSSFFVSLFGLALPACSAKTSDGHHGSAENGVGKNGESGKGGGTGETDASVFGNNRDASVSGSDFDGSVSGRAGNTTVCADQDVQVSRVTPTVMMIIDQSGSMTTAFDGTVSRWDALRSFLLASDGLIHDLQGQVRFGLAMYSAMEGAAECPMVTTVAPKLDNFSAIAKAYEAAVPLNDTPTGDSIDAIVKTLDLTKLDTNADPIVFILATDGEPDRCEELNPQNGQQESIDAVTRAYALGIKTFLISVGDEVSEAHQQDVANAGVGHQAGDANAMYWHAGDDATLRSAITEIVGKQLSCSIKLKGKVSDGDPCDGTVTLNGKPLACDGKDGWKLVDPTHIKLQGKACTDLETLPAAMLHVTFPCSVGVLF